MRLLLTVDHHFIRTPDGRIWVKTIYGYNFWMRYLQVFDRVRIAGRVRDVEQLSEEMLLSSGPGVEFYGLPEYRGPWQYLRKWISLNSRIQLAADGCDCAIFRIPSAIASTAWRQYKRTNKPYSVEVVCDPWDVMDPGTTSSPVRPIVRRIWYNQVRNMCLQANGVSYVTEHALQTRYPSRARIEGISDERFESCYSSITLKDDFFSQPRNWHPGQTSFTLVHTNSCITDYSKGHHVVIRTLARLREQGFDVRVVFIGDGPMRAAFERYAREQGVDRYVRFTGLLSGAEAVRQELVKGDIFIFPTRGEGLPRAVIEAMAVGLPCLSTPVNGIPELLEQEFLLKPEDDEGFAHLIRRLILNPDRMSVMSRHNIEKAKEYRAEVLDARRKEFYGKLRKLAEKALKRGL